MKKLINFTQKANVIWILILISCVSYAVSFTFPDVKRENFGGNTLENTFDSTVEQNLINDNPLESQKDTVLGLESKSSVTIAPNGNAIQPTTNEVYESNPNTGTTSQTSTNNSSEQERKSQQLNPTSALLNVKLSINGGSSFEVAMRSGSNVCDVLNQAKSEGLISELNMKYDAYFKTYAVYSINGKGSDNAVWWTYKINNQSPPQGCSHVYINNSDQISWEYVGS